MSTAMGITEIKAHLTAVLHRVAQGETIIITRYGKPVAQLVLIARRRPVLPSRASRS
jgi:prevent-host-death family protein